MAKSHYEQLEVKLSRRGREMLNEGEEIRSSKRKVIRVDSEETQDYGEKKRVRNWRKRKRGLSYRAR